MMPREGHSITAVGIPAKNSYNESNCKETSDKFKLREALQNYWTTCMLKKRRSKIMKDKERLGKMFQAEGV